jgi:hypothetical protein
MSDYQIRRAETGNRREGRRSLAAYRSHARGIALLVDNELGVTVGEPRRRGRGSLDRSTDAWNAGVALALVYPLMRRARRAVSRSHTATDGAPSQASGGQRSGCMKKKPSIESLETVSIEEAAAYLEASGGDELSAARVLACDRNRMDGSNAAPDDAEVHHAFFLLCRARGKHPPSFDDMRFELRRRAAA